jgi:hypothetical protein
MLAKKLFVALLLDAVENEMTAGHTLPGGETPILDSHLLETP